MSINVKACTWPALQEDGYYRDTIMENGWCFETHLAVQSWYLQPVVTDPRPNAAAAWLDAALEHNLSPSPEILKAGVASSASRLPCLSYIVEREMARTINT